MRLHSNTGYTKAFPGVSHRTQSKPLLRHPPPFVLLAEFVPPLVPKAVLKSSETAEILCSVSLRGYWGIPIDTSSVPEEVGHTREELLVSNFALQPPSRSRSVGNDHSIIFGDPVERTLSNHSIHFLRARCYQVNWTLDKRLRRRLVAPLRDRQGGMTWLLSKRIFLENVSLEF